MKYKLNPVVQEPVPVDETKEKVPDSASLEQKDEIVKADLNSLESDLNDQIKLEKKKTIKKR